MRCSVAQAKRFEISTPGDASDHESFVLHTSQDPDHFNLIYDRFVKQMAPLCIVAFRAVVRLRLY